MKVCIQDNNLICSIHELASTSTSPHESKFDLSGIYADYLHQRIITMIIIMLMMIIIIMMKVLTIQECVKIISFS